MLRKVLVQVVETVHTQESWKVEVWYLASMLQAIEQLDPFQDDAQYRRCLQRCTWEQ